LLRALETNPKQFPKKHGKLGTVRAADVRFRDGVVWRAVFSLDEATRTVLVQALGPHDTAYADAERRT
jgi:mRNA-degrading endonuclease RelE of RelBE toxin-antitoxin system